MAQRIVHFEIHAENPERAVDFYTSLFGWNIQKWNGPIDYWLIDTGQGMGINGGLMKRHGPPPMDGAAINSFGSVIGVDDLDALIAAIPTRGGKIVLPKNEVPGIGHTAYAKDTEGNIFGMMQPLKRT